MFGSKQAKEERLKQMVKFIEQRGEVTQREIARALGVSEDTIADDLVTLETRRILLCQRGQKISLFKQDS